MKKLIVPLLMVLTLSACKDKPTNDVQYYLDNPSERAEKLAECKNNPGEKAIEANCLNAGEAQRKAMFQGSGMPKIQ